MRHTEIVVLPCPREGATQAQTQKLLSSGCEARPAEWALGARQHTLQSSHCEVRPEVGTRGERSQWSHLRLPENPSDPGGLLLVKKGASVASGAAKEE